MRIIHQILGSVIVTGLYGMMAWFPSANCYPTVLDCNPNVYVMWSFLLLLVIGAYIFTLIQIHKIVRM